MFQRQLGTGLLSTPGAWEEIDDWFTYAKTLPTIEEELKALPQPNDMTKSVYVIHIPPLLKTNRYFTIVVLYPAPLIFLASSSQVVFPSA